MIELTDITMSIKYTDGSLDYETTYSPTQDRVIPFFHAISALAENDAQKLQDFVAFLQGIKKMAPEVLSNE